MQAKRLKVCVVATSLAIGTIAPVWTSSAGAAKPLAITKLAKKWVVVPATDTAFAGAQVLDVVASGKVLVAIGQVGTKRAIWTSKDGLRWQRVPDTALSLSPEQLAVPKVDPTVYRDFLAVGDERGVTVLVDRAVLSTKDGVTWQVANPTASGTTLRDPNVPATTTTMFADWWATGIAEHNGRTVVVGTGCWCSAFGVSSTGLAPSSGPTSPFALASLDGQRFTGAPLGPQPPAGSGTSFDGHLGFVVASTMTGFVAAGRSASAVASRDAVVWRSADGSNWTPVSHSELASPGSEWITQLAASGNRLLALGLTGTANAAPTGLMFWSDDGGLTWTRSAADPAVFGPSGPSRVISVGTGFVLAGGSQDPKTTRRSTL